MAVDDTVIWNGASTSVYSTAGNYQADGPPAVDDAVIFPDGNTVAVDGSDENATALFSFTTKAGYSGTIGAVTAGLPVPLKLAATTFNLGGSGVAVIDLTANSTTTCNVSKAAASPGIGQYGLTLSSADTITNLNIKLANGESVGVAALAGQSGTFTNVSIDGAGTVTLGSGLGTIEDLQIDGTGIVYIDCDYMTLTMNGTPTIYQRSGAGATLLAQGGRFFNNTIGTIETTSVFPGATVDCTDGPQARAMTTINVHGDGVFDDSDKKTTWTTLNDYGSGVNIKLGVNKTHTRGAIA